MREMTNRHSHYCGLDEQFLLMMPWLFNQGYLLIDENAKIVVNHLNLAPHVCESVNEMELCDA